MNTYQEIIEKILLEVDEDIREIMMKEDDNETFIAPNYYRKYKGYDYLQNPVNTILKWQELRDRNK